MRLLKVEPVIYRYKDCDEFWEAFRIGKDDLIITSQNIYYEFLKNNIKESAVILVENYGEGYPSDDMIQSIYESIRKIRYERVIAIGNDHILQIGKIFSLSNVYPVKDLFEQNVEILKEKELVLVPSILGVTNEMTNICTLKFSEEEHMRELIEDELYADSVILIPQLLKILSFKNFIVSSINIFMQASYLYVSLKSNEYIRLFAEKSISIILNGYRKLEKEGREFYINLFEEFLLSNSYINIAYSNISQSFRKENHFMWDFFCLSDYLNKYFDGNSSEDSLKFIDLMSRVLECDKDNVYEIFTGILRNIIPEISLV